MQSPVRRTPRKEQTAIAPSGPARAVGPVPATAETGFTDATPHDLLKLARTPGLTGAQIAKLLAPHIGKRLSIDGPVNDVNQYSPRRVQVVIQPVDGDDDLRVLAHFSQDTDRIAALHRGARVRLRGEIEEVSGVAGLISLEACELTD
jgi:hypothetical protein